jgi:hypothetical protein
VATEDEHSLVGNLEQVRVEIGDLDEQLLLVTRRIRLPSPSHDVAGAAVDHGDELGMLGIAYEVDADREDARPHFGGSENLLRRAGIDQRLRDPDHREGKSPTMKPPGVMVNLAWLGVGQFLNASSSISPAARGWDAGFPWTTTRTIRWRAPSTRGVDTSFGARVFSVTRGFVPADFDAGSPGPTIVKPSARSTLFVSLPAENSSGRSSRPVASAAASERTYFGG